MRMTIGRLAVGIAVAVAMLCTTQISSAQSLGADTISLFPKNIGEFAYANLKAGAFRRKWFPQLQEQIAAGAVQNNSKSFLASAGVDPNSQVEELAWGLVAEGRDRQDVGGRIGGGCLQAKRWWAWRWEVTNPQSTEAYFQSAKVADLQVARVYDVRIWQRIWRERSVLFVFGFEHRCVLGIAANWKKCWT